MKKFLIPAVILQRVRMLHIILNPVSGKKKATKNLRIVQDMLIERGIAFEVHATGAAHDGEKIARRLTEQGETEFIVLGGDGTLHEVLNGLADPSVCKIGLVPSGTGNDFANRLNLPLDAEKAMKIILDGEAAPVDYFQVSDRRCMNVCGLGIDVDVLERCQRGRMKGKFKYLWSLIRSLFAFKGYRVEIQSGDVSMERDVLICTACNGNVFGGGIKICPTADPMDGKLDVIVVDQIGGKFKIIKAFIELMKGRILEYPLTTYFQTEHVRVETENPAPIQLDGEVYQNHAFDVTVKQGLRFY